MDPNVIVLAVALLIVAGALVAVAMALLRRPTAEKPDEKPEAQAAKPVADVVADHEDSSGSVEEIATDEPEKLRVLKVIDLPDGQVEVLIEWDPNREPSAFRGKTLEEANKNALDAIRVKRAAQANLGDY